MYSFSGPVPVYTSGEAEIEAILHVVGILISQRFPSNNFKIAICSDSVVAIEEVRMGLRKYVPLNGLIQNLSSLLGSLFTLHYVPREINENADSLAKAGLGRNALSSIWASTLIFH